MNNSQRKVLLIVGVILAPILFLYGLEEDSLLIAFGGPLLSVGIGIYFWVGRTKEQPSGDG